MPIFEYKCNHCNNVADKIVGYKKRKEPIPCNKCKTGHLLYQEKVHTGSFKLKGKDWYKPGHS